MLSLTFWTSTTLFSMTIMNPMLSDIYGIEPEKSSLLFTLSGVAFLCSTPIAFTLRSRKLAKRRAIIFFAQIVMGAACILRTGNLLGEMNLWLVYISQILNGFAMALLTTTSFPEIVDNAEKSEFYHLYNKEAIQLWISGTFVLWISIANAIGTFLGSVAADAIGYSWSFVAAGCYMVTFTIIYASVCGTGNMTDDEI